MPETLQKALRTRLARSPMLRRHLEDLHLLTGLDVTFLDPLGNVLLTCPRGGAIPLCQRLRKAELTGRACTLCRQAVLLEPPAHPVPCRAGLRQLRCPILLDGAELGALVLSGYRDPDHSLEESKAAWIRIARSGSSHTWRDWETAFLCSPALTPQQTQALCRWLNLALRDALRRVQELSPEPMRQEDTPFPPIVRKACDLIHDRYATSLLLSEVAQACNVSSEHLSRLFHQSTGMRFREYLAEVRFNHACELLTASTRPVADIAASVGFHTLSRFNSGFLAHTGMTPTAYRKRKTPFSEVRKKGFQKFRSSEPGD